MSSATRAFDQRFRISTREPELTRRLIAPTLIELFLDGVIEWLDLADRELMVTWPGLVDAASLTARLEVVQTVAELIERQTSAAG
jgi:hypothetical protein